MAAAIGKCTWIGSLMTYVGHMGRVLTLDGGVYRALAATPLPLRYAMLNVALLGLFYGAASVHFATRLLAGQGDAAADFNPVMLLLVGMSLAFVMHGGLALFVWVFCRGIGGNPQFMPIYLFIGVAAIALWPLVPAVSAMQTGAAGPALTTYAVLAAAYGAAILFAAVKAASGLSAIKMTLAAAATVAYVGCFLYLWL